MVRPVKLNHASNADCCSCTYPRRDSSSHAGSHLARKVPSRPIVHATLTADHLAHPLCATERENVTESGGYVSCSLQIASLCDLSRWWLLLPDVNCPGPAQSRWTRCVAPAAEEPVDARREREGVHLWRRWRGPLERRRDGRAVPTVALQPRGIGAVDGVAAGEGVEVDAAGHAERVGRQEPPQLRVVVARPQEVEPRRRVPLPPLEPRRAPRRGSASPPRTSGRSSATPLDEQAGTIPARSGSYS